MQYRRIGASGLRVSAVGFGCWQIGGYYWGRVDEAEWVAAVHRALDLGVTFFDTADFYGFGRSEEMLARALGSRREEVVIATKVGLLSCGGRHDFAADDLLALEDYIEKDLSRQHIRRAAEASLRRLRTEVIDLYLLHWPDPARPIQETMGAMEELVQAGKVRAVGCCNFSATQMREASRCFRLQAHELPYNMLDRSAEQELLPACRAEAVSAIAYWALGKGLLTGKFAEHSAFGADDWRHYDPLFHGDTFRHRLQVVERLKQVASDEGFTMGQLAIAWVLQQPGVSAAVVGAKRPDQVEENARAGDVTVSAGTLARIGGILEHEPQ